MSEQIVGDLIVRQQGFAVVTSRFNETITKRLHESAVETLQHHGCSGTDITEVWVPGAFELPLAASELAVSGRFDAVIALGCVIRGATPHFDYICTAVSQGLAQVALQTRTPVAFGVLTTHTLEQALERASGNGDNKGAQAALAAIEMVNLLGRIAALRTS